MFQYWVNVWSAIGTKLLPYNYPMLKARDVDPIRPQEPMPQARDGNAITMAADPVRAARLYQQFMQAPRQLVPPSPGHRSLEQGRARPGE